MSKYLNKKVVILPSGVYKDKMMGHIGIIETTYKNKFGIRIEEQYNNYSCCGLYWFERKYIQFLDEENENIIEEENIKMTGNYKVVNIKFLDSTNVNSVYHYAMFDDCAEAGDMVVVHTSHHGLALAKVDSISEKDEVTCGREVVCKVNMEAYNSRVETREKKTKLKAEMDKKVAEIQQEAIYAMLAEKNPDLKELLEEYKSLEA